MQYYGYETQDDIPERPGIYAWYLPLFLPEDLDVKVLEEFYSETSRVLFREMSDPNKFVAKYWWETYDFNIKRSPIGITANMKECWKKLVESEDETKEAFSQALLQASVFLPPLYVGRANNLQRRYKEHSNSAVGSFHSRFEALVNGFGGSIDFTCLIFCCTEIETENSKEMQKEWEGSDRVSSHEKSGLLGLLEGLLQRFSGPPFSNK